MTGASGSAADDEGALALRGATDREAFAALYGRWFDPVYWYCLGRLGNEAEAEDATSQVFAKTLAALPRFRPEAGSFRAWLFTIAHNVVTDALRARRWDRPLDVAQEVTDTGVCATPEVAAVASEERRALHEQLARLTPDQRRVIELRLAGLTGNEIAEVLGRGRGAVDALQFRAVARLRALMGVPARPGGGGDGNG